MQPWALSTGKGSARCHIQTGLLWAQLLAAEKRFKFGKVRGQQNQADLFTKHLDGFSGLAHTTTSTFDFTIGRAMDAPILDNLSQSWNEVTSRGNFEEWK